jgi:vacuolar protein sorting-associated protein 13A/C
VAINQCSSYRTGSSKDEEDLKSFTDEDWERLNQIIGYKENNEYIPDQQDMKLMQFDFEIRMNHVKISSVT